MNKTTLNNNNHRRLQLNLMEIAAYNTHKKAPRFLAHYIKKFNESNFEKKDWRNFIAYLQIALPEDIKFELIDEQTLIFKGAIEQNALSTNPSELLTKKN